ncbi:MAG: helix-turn-helix domain-containing protein [Polyangiales bacterium]
MTDTKRSGRPRSFDRDAAVDTAMQLFWRHGYEGVSIGDLTEAIGIAAPSLYAAFGSKADLFREALVRYDAQLALDERVFEGDASLPRAVRAMLRASARAVTREENPRGCMVSSGMIACHPDHAQLADELGTRRRALAARLAECLSRWLDARQAANVARYLCAVMQGISVQARDGASLEELYAIAELAVQTVPDSPERKSRR